MLLLVTLLALCAGQVHAQDGSNGEYGLGILAAHIGPAGSDNTSLEGYLLYCHCMGRFGNQIDHLLGALSWAKRINRTLVIPPFIEYAPGATTFRPFTDVFALAPLAAYHRVVDLETFMTTLAPTVWPAPTRTVYCYARGSPTDCRAKEGNPPGTFWNHFNVDFVHQIGHALSYQSSPADWARKFPVHTHPVIATSMAPGPYPVAAASRPLQGFLQWTSARQTALSELLVSAIVPAGEPWVAVHARAGSDWANACVHAVGQREYMSSPQCPPLPPGGQLTRAMCLPTPEEAAPAVVAALKRVGGHVLYIGTDTPAYAVQLADLVRQNVPDLRVARVPGSGSDPLTDLALFGAADEFVGNCVSSFTAFAKRARDVAGLPTSFFGRS